MEHCEGVDGAAAQGPCDHARLGAAEQELDRRCGPGTIDRIAADVRPTEKVKAVARREMSAAFTIRAVLLMTLMVRHEALLFRMEVKDPMALPP